MNYVPFGANVVLHISGRYHEMSLLLNVCHQELLINHIIDYMICDGDTGGYSKDIIFCGPQHSAPATRRTVRTRLCWSQICLLCMGLKCSPYSLLLHIILLVNIVVVCQLGTAYQLAQLIRILLDPENMALGANVSYLT